MTMEHGGFAGQLRRWRALRWMSQLDVAIRADTTQRHVSFLEQGRSKPGSTTVLRLAESLDLLLAPAECVPPNGRGVGGQRRPRHR